MPVCVPGLVVIGEGGGRGGARRLKMHSPTDRKPELASPLTVVGDECEDLALDSYM